MRVLALPVLRLVVVVGALVFAAAALAGAVRLLPLAFAPDVPSSLAPALARGVVELALEVALFVAPPVAWAVASARLVERGDARALAALGVGPARVVAGGWAALLVAFVLGGAASFAWGLDASAPGRSVSALVAAGRAACAARPDAERPRVVGVPLTGLAWACFPGEDPRAILPIAGGVLSARDLTLSSDARTLTIRGVTLALAGDAPVVLRAGEARVHGLAGLGLPASNLSAHARAALLSLTALALSILAGVGVLARGRGALHAAVVGAAAPVGSMLVFSALEQAPLAGGTFALPYLLVPLAGAAAACVALAAPLGAQFADRFRPRVTLPAPVGGGTP